MFRQRHCTYAHSPTDATSVMSRENSFPLKRESTKLSARMSTVPAKTGIHQMASSPNTSDPALAPTISKGDRMKIVPMVKALAANASKKRLRQRGA